MFSKLGDTSAQPWAGTNLFVANPLDPTYADPHEQAKVRFSMFRLIIS